MKPKTALAELLKDRPKTDSWFWCKPSSGHVEQLTTSQEWELLEVAGGLWGDDPADVVELFELGNPFVDCD